MKRGAITGTTMKTSPVYVCMDVLCAGHRFTVVYVGDVQVILDSDTGPQVYPTPIKNRKKAAFIRLATRYQARSTPEKLNRT